MIFKKFMDSLSLTFPKGESYFMRAIRHYYDELPLYLQERMDTFEKDEIRHTRFHREYNQTLGLNLLEINRETDIRLNKMGQDPESMLKTTLILEKLTRWGAKVLPYIHKPLLKDVPEPMKTNWLVHGREEVKHTSDVAEVGKYLGITRKELLAHSPKVVLGLLKQIASNYRRLS